MSERGRERLISLIASFLFIYIYYSRIDKLLYCVMYCLIIFFSPNSLLNFLFSKIILRIINHYSVKILSFMKNK